MFILMIRIIKIILVSFMIFEILCENGLINLEKLK